MPRRALVALAATIAAAGLVPAAASASSHDEPVRHVCADRVVVRDSPGGFVIARLYRPQTLTVLSIAEEHRWALVAFRHGPRGWVLTASLCPQKDDDA